MSLFERAKEFEDMPDSQIAQIAQQGGEQSADTLLAATEIQRRKDVRDRYQAQLKKHQDQQQAQQGPDDVISQRVQELTQMGGGITGVDPGMPLEDPRLQQGIATPPDVQALQRAYGGLIRGYQGGDLIDDPLSPRRRGSSMGIDLITGKPRDTLDRIANLGEFDMSITPVEDVYAGQGVNLGEAQTRLGHDPRSRSEIPFREKLSRFLQRQPIGDWSKDEIREIQRMMESGELDSSDPDVVGQLRSLAGVTGIQDIELPPDLFGIETSGVGETTRDLDTTQAMLDYAAEGGNALEEINAMREEAGLPPLEEGQGAEIGLGEEGDPDDWIRAIMEGQQADRRSMYQTARGDIQDYQDAMLNRTELDEAYNELRRKDADLARYQGERKGIRGLAERDREREFAESRQKLSGDTVQSRRDLLDWDRERIGNLQRGTDMLVGLGPEDDYLRNIHEALGKVSTESTDIEHTALDSIVDQLEQGKTWEKEDYKQVFTTGETAQDQIDRALADRQLFGTTRAGEEANRKRNVLRELLDPRVKLGIAGMGEEGANYRAQLAESGAQLRAQQAAKVNMKSLTSDPAAFLVLEQVAADVINETEDEELQQEMRDALLEIGVGMVSSAVENVRGTLTPASATYTGSQGITTQAQAEQLAEYLQTLIDSGNMPPALIRKLAGG